MPQLVFEQHWNQLNDYGDTESSMTHPRGQQSVGLAESSRKRSEQRRMQSRKLGRISVPLKVLRC